MATDQKSAEFAGTTKAVGKGKKLLERAWEALWAAGFEESAARRYLAWMLDYIVFHGKRHPQEMGVPEVRAFLADDRFSGPAGAQRVEAAAAIRFLYEVVLERHWPRGALEGVVETNATRPQNRQETVYLNGRQAGVSLLDRVRNALRVGQYALETEKTYLAWIEKYSLFHGERPPEEMGALEVEQFLTHLAVKQKVAEDTQRQALNALVFLYRTVLGQKLGKIMAVRGRQGRSGPGDRFATPAGGPFAGTNRPRPPAARGRRSARAGSGLVADRIAAEVSQCGTGTWLAISFSVESFER